MEKHMLQSAGKTPLKVTGHFYNQIDGFQIVVTSIEPAAAPPLIPVSLLEVDSDRQRPRDNPSKDETDAQRYGSKITFANTSRVVGERGGNQLYEWRLYCNANVFPRNTVKEVQYTLHSSFSPRTARPTSSACVTIIGVNSRPVSVRRPTPQHDLGPGGLRSFPEAPFLR
jgi:hypothetical protein